MYEGSAKVVSGEVVEEKVVDEKLAVKGEKSKRIQEDCIELRVAEKSNPHQTAESIYKTFLEGKNFEVRVMGKAIPQAVKAIAIARGKLAQSGYHTLLSIGFRDAWSEFKKKDVSVIIFKFHEVQE